MNKKCYNLNINKQTIIRNKLVLVCTNRCMESEDIITQL